MEQHSTNQTNTNETLYTGVRVDDLPSYLKERLKTFFETAESTYKNELSENTYHGWKIKISQTDKWSESPMEWVIYQKDECFSFPKPPVYPEEYGYQDHLCSYKVEVIDGESGKQHLKYAIKLFQFLQDELSKFHWAEEIGISASYSMIRAERDINLSTES